MRLGEEVENSFAVDRDAVYIVSDKRMYRFSAGTDGRPRIDWKVTLPQLRASSSPARSTPGSGTTPTVMDGGYVAITDNADPMNVVVYRTARRLRRGQRRVVCQVPVFAKGASATENSLLTAGRIADRREQLRLPGPVRPARRRADRSPASRASTSIATAAGCRKVLDEHHRARAVRRAQALDAAPA